MKVKKKVREQTAIEKRNTSISIFALAAIIPLLLALLLGFNLAQTENVNASNLKDRLVKLQKEHLELQNNYSNMENQLLAINKVFVKSDSIFESYEDKISSLEGDLSTIASKGGIVDWKFDVKEADGEFEVALKNTVKDAALNNDNRTLQEMLKMGQKWLIKFLLNKGRELEIRGFYKDQELTPEITPGTFAGPDPQVQQLQRDLFQKDLEITQLKNDLKNCSGDLVDDVGDKEQKIIELTKRLGACKANSTTVKGAVDQKIEGINKMLVDLTPKLLSTNKKRINEFKDNLEIELDAIRIQVAELK